MHPPRAVLPVMLVTALAVAACGSSSSSGSRDDASSPTVHPGGSSALTDVGVGFEEVTSFDQSAMAMAVRPGDDDLAYVAIRTGTLERVDLAAGPDGPTETVLDFSADVSTDGEQGFLGAAFSPDGDRLYASYTNPEGDTRIDEYAVTGSGGGTSIDTASRTEVFAQDQPFSNHNGGNIVFGPDGYLYLGLGDGGDGGDPDNRGQDRTDLLGKVLRLDPVGRATSGGVPEDNPYADGADGRAEIWITGVRNPWRFSFDTATGDLWIADVGQEEVEEVDFLPADPDGRNAGRDANLGWSLMEGDQPFDGGEPPAGYTAPIATMRHEDGPCSITGGYVYRGDAIPELQGAYLYSDFCASMLSAVRVDDSGQVAEELDLGPLPVEGPVSFGQDAGGELYVLSFTGEVTAITPP